MIAAAEEKQGAVLPRCMPGDWPLPVQGRRLGSSRGSGAHMGRTLSPKHHRAMKIEPPGSMHCSNLQAFWHHHIHLAPTAKGLPTLPFLLLGSLS